MAAPLLQADIEIDAPPATVWRLISDLRQMPRWSPQCRVMKPLGAVRAGVRTLNLNRHGRLFWPTISTVTEFVPERTLAFRIDANHTVWKYELEPTASGTRLTEARHAEHGVTAISSTLVDKLMGGASNFDAEMLDGIRESLLRIKTAAEAEPR